MNNQALADEKALCGPRWARIAATQREAGYKFRSSAAASRFAIKAG